MGIAMFNLYRNASMTNEGRDSQYIGTQMSLIIFRVTGLKLTTLLHNVAGYLCYKCMHLNADIPFFLNASAKTKVVINQCPFFCHKLIALLP